MGNNTFGANPLVTHEVAQFGLGEERDIRGTVYRYCQNQAAATSKGQDCLISNANVATPQNTAGVSSIGGLIGIPEVDVAANYYAWFIVGPTRNGTDHKALMAASVSSGVNLTTTTTAGTVGTGGTAIKNAVSSAASGAGGLTTFHANGRLTVN